MSGNHAWLTASCNSDVKYEAVYSQTMLCPTWSPELKCVYDFICYVPLVIDIKNTYSITFS